MTTHYCSIWGEYSNGKYSFVVKDYLDEVLATFDNHADAEKFRVEYNKKRNEENA